MVEVETITDGGRALKACGDLFDGDPIGSNMVAGVLRQDTLTQLLVVRDGARALGAMVDWPSGWTLTRLQPGAHDALAERLPMQGGRLWGAAPDVLTLSQRWAERSGGAVDLDELMRMYELRLPTATTTTTEGELAIVEPTDDVAIDRAARWALAFGDEVGHGREGGHGAAVAQMQRAADERRLHVLRFGERILAHLLTSPERFGVVRIGGVYTPPEHRGRGHASALTAATSAALLSRSAVRSVTLLTQADNASTNRMYRRLGFTHVYDALSVDLRSR